ncbi:MAG TPA: hypothetical protein VFA62_03855, partial [Acidimicrobiia bacterium]|nr:hypothetical protein [Acidimicrobiia bacterium]
MATDVRTQEQLRNPRIDEGIYNAWQRQWLKITTAQGDQNAFELKTAPAGGIPQLVTGVRTGEDVVPDPHADFAVRHVGTGGFGCRDSADTRYNLYVADGGVATLYSALVIQGNGSPTWALDVTGPVRLSGSLTIGGDLVVGGNTTMNGGLGVFGLATLHSGLDVTGLATLHTGLAVTGASTFNGAITQQGGMVEFDYPDHTLYVDYPGNEVGIGTNTPGSKLDIVQNAGDASLTVRATNQGTGAQTQTQFRAVNAQGAFAYEGMTDGGYTSFAPINGVAGKGSGFWLCYNAARAVFGCQDTGEIQFSIGGGTVGRFDSIGRMAVGASPPSTSYTLHVQGPLGVTGLVSALAGLTANGLITGTAGLTISGGASSLAAQVRVDTTAAVGTHKLVVWGTGAGASGAVTTAAELGIYGSTGATLMAYASPVEVALQAAAAGTVGRVGSTTNHSFQLLANGTPALVVVPQASGAVGLTVQQQTSGNVGATLFAGGDLVVGDSSHGGFAVPNL